MKAKKSNFRKVIGAVLLLAFMLNISVPAYAEFSAAKNSEQLKSIFGDDFKICSENNSKTISFSEYFKLIHGFADSEKISNSFSKDSLGKTTLSNQVFVQAEKSSFTTRYVLSQINFTPQTCYKNQASRAPPVNLI